MSDTEILNEIRGLLGAGGTPSQLEALHFYADPATWKPGGDEFNPTPAPIAADRGAKARAALGMALPNPAHKNGKKVAATKAPKPKKGKKRVEEEEDDSPKRPPVRMVTLKCAHCPRTQEMVAGTEPRRFTEKGESEVAPWVCGGCIKARKVLA
jgi:hypothetical protein